jgi:hypothetical protein
VSATPNHVEALVGIVNTQLSRAFTMKFAASPIRIGRAQTNSLCLEHPAVARSHGEISFGPDAVVFRSRALMKSSWVDGTRIKRGRAVELTETSVITLGPFRLEVCMRTPWTARDHRSTKVTPVASTFPPGWNRRWSLDDLAEPYLAVETWPPQPTGSVPPRAAAALETFASGLLELKRALKRQGDSDLAEFRNSSELIAYLVDPLAPSSRLDALDEELTSIAALVALDLASSERQGK